MSLRPRARIHLSNIAANWRRMDALSGEGGAGAVVKADAYGHGIGPVSKALADAGCRTFFVAYGFEGVRVREAVGPDAEIYVFNGLAALDRGDAISCTLRPVLNSTAEIAEWRQLDWGTPFALHVDTGMNRLGVRPRDVGAAAEQLNGKKPSLLMTHFACADDPSSPMTTAQLESLSPALKAFPDVPLSLSNSAGQWLGPEFRQGLTRPGIALYGGGNSVQRPRDLLPGMTLEAPILQVSRINTGEPVGYGATYRAKRPTDVATVAIGYGDGVLRAASNSGFGYIGGVRCPIIGRVSMDLITFDVSAVGPLAKPGAWVELLGAQADLEEQAAAASTLGYELTTGLGPRVERIYEN
ncbi:MAG: alanine racemase [Pseudomonadota bacterium]